MTTILGVLMSDVQQGPPPASGGWRAVRVLPVLALVLVAVLAAGAGIALKRSQKPTHEIIGTFTLIDSDVRSSGSGCRGTNGYDDIEDGLQVVVKDGKGTILGTSNLENSHHDSGENADVTCLFDFTVPRVAERSFYSIEVGRRGALTYSLADMKSRGWHVDFTVG